MPTTIDCAELEQVFSVEYDNLVQKSMLAGLVDNIVASQDSIFEVFLDGLNSILSDVLPVCILLPYVSTDLIICP